MHSLRNQQLAPCMRVPTHAMADASPHLVSLPQAPVLHFQVQFASNFAPARRLALARDLSCAFKTTESETTSSSVGRVQGLETLETDGIYEEEIACIGDDCPEIVAEIMRSEEDVLTASPSESLEAIIPRLNEVVGLSVTGNDGKLIGMICRKDIIKVRKSGGSMQDTVAMHMTSPAISSVQGWTSVQEAGDIMLKKKIRILPVVDEEGCPIGTVSRTDIFRPLMAEAHNEFMRREIAAICGDDEISVAEARSKVKRAKKPVSWQLKYLYDGDCAMCQSLKAVLERQDRGRGIVKFVNISDENYKPKSNMGITYDEAMATIHSITSKGEVLMGTEALKRLFDSVGLGWATKLTELAVFAWLMDVVYEFLSANRLALGSMGGLMDVVIVSKRMTLSKEGVQTCGDLDEECAVDW